LGVSHRLDCFFAKGFFLELFLGLDDFVEVFGEVVPSSYYTFYYDYVVKGDVSFRITDIKNSFLVEFVEIIVE